MQLTSELRVHSECSPGKRGGCPLHSVPSDLPTDPRHLTRSPVGHGRPATIFPCGYRTNTPGEQHTHTRTHTYTVQEHYQHMEWIFVPASPLPMINIPFQVQMIRGGIILPSKLSMSLQKYIRLSPPLREALLHPHQPFSLYRKLRTSSSILP